jgi:hypothetical protein
MSSRRSQRRQLHRNHMQPVVEIFLRKRTLGNHLGEVGVPVAAITRTSTLIVWLSPIRLELALLQPRSSLVCSAPLTFPTSSRKSVPLCASARTGPDVRRPRR